MTNHASASQHRRQSVTSIYGPAAERSVMFREQRIADQLDALTSRYHSAGASPRLVKVLRSTGGTRLTRRVA